MKFPFLFLCLVAHLACVSQQSPNPVEMTAAMQNKIKQDIEKEVIKIRTNATTRKINSVQLEFTIDTFRIESFMGKWLELDYSDPGMRNGTSVAANMYDSLLNKYYKKLLAALKGDDKKTVIQAQKAWLTFRDAEMKLIETIGKDQYSGGGTMERLTESSEYLKIIKERTIAIFNHYTRASQSE